VHQQNHPQPPAWADQLLQWRLGEDTSEEVIGDLHELFEQWVNSHGVRHARLRYILNALVFLRPLPRGLRKRKNKLNYHNTSPLIPTIMFYNYFKIARRNLLRNKVNTTINITGSYIGTYLLFDLVFNYKI
jgi:putative ABC transport system permease protein